MSPRTGRRGKKTEENLTDGQDAAALPSGKKMVPESLASNLDSPQDLPEKAVVSDLSELKGLAAAPGNIGVASRGAPGETKHAGPESSKGRRSKGDKLN
ncbi:MAG: hypothetical protein LBO05_14725 [Deltaproteobacteria bacterium]|nr:hypothetical protein [Deltaproteobacteria bacterium]